MPLYVQKVLANLIKPPGSRERVDWKKRVNSFYTNIFVHFNRIQGLDEIR